MFDNQDVKPSVPVSSKSDNNLSSGSERNSNIKKYLSLGWEFFKIIVVAAIIVLPIRYFLFQPFIVKGESMFPYLRSGDYLIVDEISYRFSDPKRGDIVVLDYPLDLSQRFIKRVVGLPGETIEVKDGKVIIINGDSSMVLEEDYLPDNLKTDGNLKTTLKEGEYFVMGDNREFSYDSRRWGSLPREDIIGRALVRVFPISTMTIISGKKY